MITRQPTEIAFSIQPDGSISAVRLSALITDTDENTAGGVSREFKGAGPLNIAGNLLASLMNIAANAGKPLTFPGFPPSGTTPVQPVGSTVL